MSDATRPVDGRQIVIDTCQALLRNGLVVGTQGNVSVRQADGNVCLSPSSTPYDTLVPAEIAVCDLDGTLLSGTKGPTSEKDLHLEVMRAYPEVGCVIHLHPVYATMFALVREPVPAVIEEVVVFIGGDIPICEYRTTGSKELAVEVASKLGDRSACLMANHGMCVIGSNPDKALHHAETVEKTARIVWGARQLGGRIHTVPDEVNQNFAGVYRYLRSSGKF